MITRQKKFLFIKLLLQRSKAISARRSECKTAERLLDLRKHEAVKAV